MLTYKQQFNKKYKQPLNQSNSLKDISRLTGYKLSGLKIIFNKGIGAYKTYLFQGSYIYSSEKKLL